MTANKEFKSFGQINVYLDCFWLGEGEVFLINIFLSKMNCLLKWDPVKYPIIDLYIKQTKKPNEFNNI